MAGPLVGTVLGGHVPSHAIQPPEPAWQRLLRSGHHRVRKRSDACVAVVTRRALTSGFRLITAALDEVRRRTRGPWDASWPTPRPPALIPLDGIEQVGAMALHRGTPGKGRPTGWPQDRPSAHSTTLEANMSVDNLFFQG